MTARGNRLVVASKSWGECIPGWLLDEVGRERFMLGLQHLRKPEEAVGDAEACTYLLTANFCIPLPPELIAAYKYVLGRVLERRGLPVTLWWPLSSKKGSLLARRKRLRI